MMIVSYAVVSRICVVCLVMLCVVSLEALSQSVESTEFSNGGQPLAEPVEELVPLQHNPLDSSYSMITSNGAPVWHEMVTNLPSDWARSAEVTFSTSGLPALLGLTAVTVALLVPDRPLYEASHSLYERSPFVKFASNQIVNLGDGRNHFILAGAFAGYGLLASDSRALRTASQTVEAVLASGVVVQILKRVSGRESPIAASSHHGKWRPFPNLKEYERHQPQYYAFPSGHIATAMSTVTVVCENYPEVRWLRPLGYSIVGLIGVGLVNKGYHWYSDLPLGIAIGHTFGMISSQSWGSEPSHPGENRPVKFTLTPSLVPYGAGVSLAVSL